ncbi:Techylectin-5A [Araneus ventricosus]|uniref:Techylectin-5A n=1 Tax=Araneus ventricosus TaxID=182803 RepID=A0A4Y2ML06_ARAVE|nr:Techylectin-5A [Araneus ventricosus]
MCPTCSLNYTTGYTWKEVLTKGDMIDLWSVLAAEKSSLPPRRVTLATRFFFGFSLLFLQLEVFLTLGYVTSACDDSGRSVSYLDAAVDMISKAKLYFPVCPAISQNSLFRPMDCEELLRSGHNESGVYTIWPRSRIMDDKSLDVFCDMDTDGGGWTVIQRRGNFSRPTDYFFKDWSSYKVGFGDIEKDFWLGNDNIYVLTNQRLSSIRFDLQAVDGEKRHAHYDDFWIEDESNKYRLHIEGYSGDAGDSMTVESHNQVLTNQGPG